MCLVWILCLRQRELPPADKTENLPRCEAQLDRQRYLPSFQTLCSKCYDARYVELGAGILMLQNGFVNILFFLCR